MRFNSWKVLLVFSVLLVFAVSGELAAQTPTDLIIYSYEDTLNLNGSQELMVRLTSSGTGVDDERIYFEVLDPPALGSVDPEDSMTVNGGYSATTYTAGITVGTDTLIAYWTDAVTREELADTAIITIEPGPPVRLRVIPEDTVVVVTEDVVIIAELFDDFLNHVDAMSPAQVSFTTSGMGSFGTAFVNGNGCIEVAYTTYDRMASDTVRVELISNAFHDYSFIRTIGAAPATMILNSEDSTVVVSETDYEEELWFYLFDAYDNPSTWSNYYAGVRYSVAFTVNMGGGIFGDNDVEVIEGGYGYNYYYSSTGSGVYTVTATSGAATADIDITQITDYPHELVFIPSSMAIPAGTDTTLTARMYDRYGNHCHADDERFDDVEWEEISGQGDLGTSYIEGHNWKCVFNSYSYAADTARIWAGYDGAEPDDEVVIFSAEPGEFHHFAFDIHNDKDTASVSDGNFEETNQVRIEAQDSNNIRLYTYTNPDTVTLSLNGSTAEASQVTWFIWDNMGDDWDTTVGLVSIIPESFFYEGVTRVYIANQIAETDTVTVADTSGHTGISPELTWLPDSVASFNVQLEGGETEIWIYDDTVNIEVTAIDMFGNTTDLGLPLNAHLIANRMGVDFTGGEIRLMDNSIELYPMVATVGGVGLIITVENILNPSVNGESYPITVYPIDAVEERPIVSTISASFGTGAISYAVAEEGDVTIKVYNKIGMEVGSLVDGIVKRGYYQTSLKKLNLPGDVYFITMKTPEGEIKKVKATLIK
jgi:hypothetical protein